jgi:hypothetical protein
VAISGDRDARLWDETRPHLAEVLANHGGESQRGNTVPDVGWHSIDLCAKIGTLRVAGEGV